MSFLRYGLGKFRCCIWKEKFASVYQSTLAWYGQVWCFGDESPKFHGRRNKFRGCPCTRVHQSRMAKQFTRALMLPGGRVTVPRSRNFSDWYCSVVFFFCICGVGFGFFSSVEKSVFSCEIDHISNHRPAQCRRVARVRAMACASLVFV